MNLMRGANDAIRRAERRELGQRLAAVPGYAQL